jgi:release factor glutamine methyltransferase
VNLLEVLRRATGYLDQHGSSSARLDAELLLAQSLDVRRLDLYLQFERPMAEGELAPYRKLVSRRAKGAPVAYLLGHKEFMNLDFEVSPEVLVPNPDTETLVERAVSWARARGGEVRVADIGTGSGCIAVAVAHYVPEARVLATDDDEAALEVAARNVARHELGPRITLERGDLLEPLTDPVDLICANLPYVDEAAELPPEVLAQPRHALFAADAGVALVRRLLEEAPARLRPQGAVLAEIDPRQQQALLPALEGYAGHRFHRDVGGLVRVVEAWT